MAKDWNIGWLNQMDGGMIGKDIPTVGMLYAVTIKITAGGVFAILKAKGGGGKVVAFVGAGGLEDLMRKIRPILSGEGGKWREDQYV